MQDTFFAAVQFNTGDVAVLLAGTEFLVIIRRGKTPHYPRRRSRFIEELPVGKQVPFEFNPDGKTITLNPVTKENK
jgi:hypothetical protein